MKNKNLIVDEEIELLSFLLKSGFGRNGAKSILKRGVLVNKQLIHQFNHLLKRNDVVYLGPVCPLELIYEDDDLLVINKPAGLLTVSTTREKEKTAYHLLREYLASKGEQLFILHRLDRDTSGVLVFCKREKLRDELQNEWNEITLKRVYVALVEGRLERDSGVIENYLLNKNENVLVYDHYVDGSKRAVMEYRVIKYHKHSTLVEVNLRTGRKNQIRATFSNLSHPVLGDGKFGDKKSFPRLALHASELIIMINKREYRFVADIPKEIK